MTDRDKPEFLQAIAKLAVALREHEPDVVQLRVYFEGLRPFEIELVVAAADRLHRSTWFPKVSEWATAAEQIEHERLEAQRAVLRKLPQPLCQACSDTGWEVLGGDGPTRVKRCACQHQRRRELLGRAPWPALPEAIADHEQAERIDAMVAKLVAQK